MEFSFINLVSGTVDESFSSKFWGLQHEARE